MKRNTLASMVATGLLLLSALSGSTQTILITNDLFAAGQPSYDFGPVTVSAFYGETEVFANAAINSGNLAYLGVNSSAWHTDGNVNAMNDADGALGGADQERLRLDIHPGYYLTNLTWDYSRADGPLTTDGVSIKGFSSNPGAVFSGGITGTPIYTNGTLTFQITTFNGTVRTVTFTNSTASTNATLEITVSDSTQGNAQFAMHTFTLGTVPPPTPVVNTQPISTSRYEQDGTNIFNVEASSLGTVYYRWFKSPSTPVAGGTNASLTIGNLAAVDAGNYFCVVSNSLGASINSDTVTLTVNAWNAPSFNLNPVSVSAYPNQSVSFTASATGSPTWSLFYQWNKGGVPIPGATETTLSLNNITGDDAGSYTCVASNGVNPNATSSAASLSLLALTPGTYGAAALGTKPLIYHRYENVTTSDTNVFNYGSLGVAGTGDVTPYGVYNPGSPLNDGPRPPDFPNFDAANSCPFFDAFIVNANIPPLGTVSNSATITAWINPSGSQVDNTGIVLQRGGSGGCGLIVRKDPVTFNDNLGYMWNSQRWNITNETLVLPQNQWTFVAVVIEPTRATLYLHDGTNMLTKVDTFNHANANLANITRVGWDSSGGANDRRFAGRIDEVTIHTRALSASEIYSLFISVSNVPPAIVDSPQNATNYTGLSFGLNVGAQGTLPLSYQWHKQGGGPIAGATNGTYTVANAVLGDAGNYFVVVSNAFGGATSSLASVTVIAQPPIITTAPQPATNWVGLNAGFSVVATGSGPLSYQWSKSGSGALSGQTNSSLTLSNLALGDSGNYLVTVTNPEGSSNSPSASLTVLDANQYTQMLFPTNGYAQLRNNFNGVIATSFRMGAIDRVITHLGFYDSGADGLSEAHNVGIFARGPNPGGGTLLAEVLVPAGTVASYTNGYRWVALSSPLTLTNGQSYLIAGTAVSGGDLWPNNWAVNWNQAYIGYTSLTNNLNFYQGSATWPTDPGGEAGGAGTSYGAYNLMSVPTTFPPVTLLIEKVGGNVQLTWPQGTLQAAGVVTGPYTNVPSAVSPYSVPSAGSNMFFRVKVN